MTARLLVVCEAAADFRIASELADRVLCERIEWLEPELLREVREWTEVAPEQSFVRWDKLDRVAEQYGLRRLRPRSRFGGEPGAADAAAADKALQLAAFIGGKQLSAVVLVRDADAQPERGRGLAQARVLEDGHTWPFAVVVGLASPKREAWVLAGFEPRVPTERERLAKLRQELGHDPCAGSSKLDATAHGAKRDIKRVLELLTDGDVEREAACWRASALARLREHGGDNGLSAYLAEVEERLVPLVQP